MIMNRYLFSILGSVVFYWFVNNVLPKPSADIFRVSAYIGIVLAFGLFLSELGNLTIKNSREILWKLISGWAFGFVGTFIVLELPPIPAILVLTLLAVCCFESNCNNPKQGED